MPRLDGVIDRKKIYRREIAQFGVVTGIMRIAQSVQPENTHEVSGRDPPMNLKKLCATGAAGFIASTTFAAAESCGDVTIAEMNWASAELMANVDAIILEEGYGCNVELIAGATQTTFASMNEKGQPDVAPELWVNAVLNLLNSAKAEGRMITLNDTVIEGIGEGWFVSPAVVENHPELDTVEKLIARPDLFPYVEDESKGAFMGCPSGWGCQLSNQNIFRAFDMENKGWTLVDPGSGAGLDGAIAKAAERGQNWLGYYWSPTSVVGKYGLIQMQFETEFAGMDHWNDCVVVEDCADPQPTSYIASTVETVVTKRFAEEASAAAEYFKTRSYPNATMGQMLVYMTEEQAAGEDAAYEFLEKYEDVWTKWVPAEVAEKVKDAL